MGFFSRIKERIVNLFKRKKEEEDLTIQPELNIPQEMTSLTREEEDVFSSEPLKKQMAIKDKEVEIPQEELETTEERISKEIKQEREIVPIEKNVEQENKLLSMIEKAKAGALGNKEKLQRAKDIRKIAHSKSDISEIWNKYSPQERIQSGFFTTEEELKNGKFDLYRNVIMNAIQDENTAKEVFRSGIIQQNMVANIIMDVTILNSNNIEIGRRTVNYEVQGLTPEMAEDKGLFRFYVNGKNNFSMKSILWTLEHEIGVKNIQSVEYQIGGGNTSDDVRLIVNKIMVRFDYHSGK